MWLKFGENIGLFKLWRPIWLSEDISVASDILLQGLQPSRRCKKLQLSKILQNLCFLSTF